MKSMEKEKILFEDAPVSTRTYIVPTNVTFLPDEIFSKTPVCHYRNEEKRRGRKRKHETEKIEKVEKPADGKIVHMQYKDKVKGCHSKNEGFFRNTLTLVMFVQGKIINVKLSKTGTLQLTGCKTESHARDVAMYIWDMVKNHPGVMFSYQSGVSDNYQFTIVPIMCNIDFSLGFMVNRENLDTCFNRTTKYYSLLETNFGHTGVNVKIKYDNQLLYDLDINRYTCINGKFQMKKIKYMEYLDSLPEKIRLKKMSKKKFCTFLIFHSGKVIMSGTELALMKKNFYDFTRTVFENKKFIMDVCV